MVDLRRLLAASLLVGPMLVYAASQERGAQAADSSAPTPVTETAPTPPAAPATETAPTPPAAPATETAPTPRDLLVQRVSAKWDAMIRNDWAAAYAFTSPEYRKLYSLEQFKRSFGNAPVDWRRIKLGSIDFDGDDAATVGVNLHFDYHDAPGEKPLDMISYFKESWVRVDGQWWYLVKK